jgi:hypothetical protein
MNISIFYTENMRTANNFLELIRSKAYATGSRHPAAKRCNFSGKGRPPPKNTGTS